MGKFFFSGSPSRCALLCVSIRNACHGTALRELLVLRFSPPEAHHLHLLLELSRPRLLAYVETTAGTLWPASQNISADWPRLAEAKGRPELDLALVRGRACWGAKRPKLGRSQASGRADYIYSTTIYTEASQASGRADYIYITVLLYI